MSSTIRNSAAAGLAFVLTLAVRSAAAEPEPQSDQAAQSDKAPPHEAGAEEKSDADGWPDLSNFLDEKYGFLPIVMPITEPAVGYGAVGGAAFLSKPLGAAREGLGRPNITFVGGLGTENGTWGTMAGDMRYWLDDRLQTLAGVLYASVNLDFHGIGKDSELNDHPLRYTLEPAAAALKTRYRLGDTLIWGGLSYAFASTKVSFDTPEETDTLPDFENTTRVGGLTPSATYDSRDTMFTPTRGSFVEASYSLFGKALGGEDSFQRAALTAIQYFELPAELYLGLRGDAGAAFGDAPFYLHPYVAMRGVPVMRYQGEEIAQLEAEVRWQFWGRFSLLGFGGAGWAWNDFEHVENLQNVYAGGTGFRYEIARRYGLHMGVDVAFSRDTTAFYVQFGSAWMRP